MDRSSAYDTDSSAFRWKPFWAKLSVRAVLLIGLLLFAIAVSLDSLQQAAAADLLSPAALESEMISQPALSETVPRLSELPAGTYLEFDAQTASRLRRSDLLGAHMTRSRLTSAHLFASPMQ